MGTIYWQLNDIWEGASWASLEYGGRWKVLQYYAKQFFEPVLVSPYIDSGVLYVYSVSDSQKVQTGTLTIQAISYSSGTQKQWTSQVSIPSLSSKKIAELQVSRLFSESGCTANTCVFQFALQSADGTFLSENFCFPGSPKYISNLQDPQIEITAVEKKREGEFIITLRSQQTALFVWLETKIPGRFSDNGFLLTEGLHKKMFFAWTDVHVDMLSSSLYVRSFYDMQ